MSQTLRVCRCELCIMHASMSIWYSSRLFLCASEPRAENQTREKRATAGWLDAFWLGVSLWRLFIIFSSHPKCVPLRALYAEIEFVINIHHQMRRAWKLGKDRGGYVCECLCIYIDNRPLRGNAFWLSRGAFWSSHVICSRSGWWIHFKQSDSP